MRPNGELPSDHYADRRGHTPGVGRQAHLAVQRPAAFSGVKALRNTSAAKAAGRQALLAFRSLDPLRALREPDRRRRDEERPLPAPNKELAINRKTPLDRESPIQVRIHLPPPKSQLRTRFPGSWLWRSTNRDPAAIMIRFCTKAMCPARSATTPAIATPRTTTRVASIRSTPRGTALSSTPRLTK